jgi:hypothetical protein
MKRRDAVPRNPRYGCPRIAKQINLIADYGKEVPDAGPNWIPIIKKRLTIAGFAMPDHFAQVPELLGKLTPYVVQGKIKYRAHVLEGLESAISGLNMFFTGDNKGKLIVKL